MVMDYNCNKEEIEEFLNPYLNLDASQNQKILHRNGKEWYEFCDGFTLDEYHKMREFVYAHPTRVKFNLIGENSSSCDDYDMLIHDYIIWLVADLAFDGQYGEAKAILNNGYVG